jgi:hypothetical protein
MILLLTDSAGALSEYASADDMVGDLLESKEEETFQIKLS